MTIAVDLGRKATKTKQSDQLSYRRKGFRRIVMHPSRAMPNLDNPRM